jgi:hypothetical protein
MPDEQTFKIRFENETVADAGQKASELRYSLLDTSPDISVQITKDDPTTQDFGATLVLILGAPAAVAIAKGIADYLSRRGGTITIEDEHGKVIAQNVKSADLARIAEAFAKKK